MSDKHKTDGAEFPREGRSADWKDMEASLPSRCGDEPCPLTADLHEYVRDQLAPEMAAQVKSHLRKCAYCHSLCDGLKRYRDEMADRAAGEGKSLLETVVEELLPSPGPVEADTGGVEPIADLYDVPSPGDTAVARDEEAPGGGEALPILWGRAWAFLHGQWKFALGMAMAAVAASLFVALGFLGFRPDDGRGGGYMGPLDKWSYAAEIDGGLHAREGYDSRRVSRTNRDPQTPRLLRVSSDQPAHVWASRVNRLEVRPLQGGAWHDISVEVAHGIGSHQYPPLDAPDRGVSQECFVIVFVYKLAEELTHSASQDDLVQFAQRLERSLEKDEIRQDLLRATTPERLRQLEDKLSKEFGELDFDTRLRIACWTVE